MYSRPEVPMLCHRFSERAAFERACRVHQADFEATIVAFENVLLIQHHDAWELATCSMPSFLRSGAVNIAFFFPNSRTSISRRRIAS
jgi:hypothetical protein